MAADPSVSPADTPERGGVMRWLREWWRDGFGWCRFLGHHFEPGVEECFRCGAVTQEVADMMTGDGADDA